MIPDLTPAEAMLLFLHEDPLDHQQLQFSPKIDQIIVLGDEVPCATSYQDRMVVSKAPTVAFSANTNTTATSNLLLSPTQTWIGLRRVLALGAKQQVGQAHADRTVSDSEHPPVDPMLSLLVSKRDTITNGKCRHASCSMCRSPGLQDLGDAAALLTINCSASHTLEH